MTILYRKNYVDKILNYSLGGFVTVLSGVRYSGKSTLLKQTYDTLKKRDIPSENLVFADILKESIDIKHNVDFLNNLFESLEAKKGDKYLFMDNIEYVEDWGRILHYFIKYNEDVHVYIAPNDSNNYTNKNISKMYKHEIQIFPFSFKEFLEYYQLNNNKKLQELTDMELFEEYQKFGGLPEVLDAEEYERKKHIIKWSYEGILFQATKELYHKRFARRLAKFLIERMGQDFSPKIFQKFVNDYSLGNFNIFNLSFELLRYYLSLIGNSELIECCGVSNLITNEVMFFDTRYYAPDPSFYFLCPYSKLNDIRVLESIIFVEFRRRDYSVVRGLLNKEEISFIHYDYNGDMTCIEVVKSLKDEKTRKEVFKKLDKVDDATKYVISMDEYDYSKDNIKHVNIIDFLKDENIITSRSD